MTTDRTRRRFLALGGTAALAGLAGCTGATPFVGKRVENAETYDADAVDAVAVDGQNGDVTVRPADGEQVRVETVTQSGSVFGDLDDVSVDVATDGGELRVETRQTGDGSFFGGVPSVDVTVDLPIDVDLGELRTENGSVDVRGVATDATLVSENGSTTARNVDGFVAAETENGSATVRGVSGVDGVATENGSVEVDVSDVRGETVVESENGSVTAAVSPDLDADVVALTDNGSVEVDLPGLESSVRSDTRVEGQLGDGGPELRFVTENGGVTVSELA
ncbi:DUF4097 domain-containing protein [Halorussus halobius]|uniref:DUF4097 domain-containing protein n=1 Tax=Halorussus halobius TaxID=1710537 RepID=UPI0010926994|nr:DUF4097 domain-containing protein [Halorussus halobius]